MQRFTFFIFKFMESASDRPLVDIYLFLKVFLFYKKIFLQFPS